MPRRASRGSGCASGALAAASRRRSGPPTLCRSLAPPPTQKVARRRFPTRPPAGDQWRFLAFAWPTDMAARPRGRALCRRPVSFALGRRRGARRRDLPDQPVLSQLVRGARLLHQPRALAYRPGRVGVAAAADETRADARQDPVSRANPRLVLGPDQSPAAAGSDKTPANLYGLQDLHGVIWEWVEDFSGMMISGDSRTQGDPDKLQYCGAGALSAEIATTTRS